MLNSILQQARSASKPDPYAVLKMGKESQQTAVHMRTSDPVWEQGFTFLVANPESDTLYLTIMDQKTGQELGTLVYNLTALADKKSLEVTQQPFALAKSGPDSKIILSMHLRVGIYEHNNIIAEQAYWSMAWLMLAFHAPRSSIFCFLHLLADL